MAIIARQTWSNDFPPARGYVLDNGMHTAFGRDYRRAMSQLVADLDHFRKNTTTAQTKQSDFLIAFIWTKNSIAFPPRKCSHTYEIETWGFYFHPKKKWPDEANIEVIPLGTDAYLKTVPYFPECVLPVLAKEEAWRKTRKDIHDYMSNPPPLEGIVLQSDNVCSLPPA